jgi:hypothetical protein
VVLPFQNRLANVLIFYLPTKKKIVFM